MQFETLRKLFLKKYPNGSIAAETDRRIWVRFRSNGKDYLYNYQGYIWLADELGLIPTLDRNAIARDIVTQLTNGASFVLAPVGCSDTACSLCDKVIMEHPHSFDEFGREISRYTLSASNGWSSTKA